MLDIEFQHNKHIPNQKPFCSFPLRGHIEYFSFFDANISS